MNCLINSKFLSINILINLKNKMDNKQKVNKPLAGLDKTKSFKQKKKI